MPQVRLVAHIAAQTQEGVGGMKTQGLTIEELADALGVKPSQVMRLGAKGEIPSYMVGRYRRFDLDEVKAALKKDTGAGKAA